MDKLWRAGEIATLIVAILLTAIGMIDQDVYYIAYATLMLVWSNRCHTFSKEAE